MICRCLWLFFLFAFGFADLFTFTEASTAMDVLPAGSVLLTGCGQHLFRSIQIQGEHHPLRDIQIIGIQTPQYSHKRNATYDTNYQPKTILNLLICFSVYMMITKYINSKIKLFNRFNIFSRRHFKRNIPLSVKSTLALPR